MDTLKIEKIIMNYGHAMDVISVSFVHEIRNLRGTIKELEKVEM